jgi:hypothetical protein
MRNPKGNTASGRRLFIHCGLHKTGTTALQTFLRDNTEPLRGAGILYPYAGRPDSYPRGQHNLAWQIARDRRFDKTWGDIEALAKEIDDFGGDLLLSSEDFEGSLGKPEAFRPLVQYAASTQRELVLIIYVRNQIPYVESIYCEKLRHGLGQEYARMVEQVINSKVYLMNEWIFHFDYQFIAKAMGAIPNVRLIFRDYHNLRADSVVTDFMSVIGKDLPIVEGANQLRFNLRDSASVSLSLFYQNRIGRPLNSAENEIVEHLCPGNQLQMKTGRVLREALASTFRRSNESFCRSCEVPSEGLLFDDVRNQAMERAARMERFFSFETQCAIKEIAALRMRPDLAYKKRMTAMAEAEHVVVAWWNNESAERLMLPQG